MEFPLCPFCSERLFSAGSDGSRHPGICPSCSSLLDGTELGDSQLLRQEPAEVFQQLVLIPDSDLAKADRYVDWGLNE
jgi:hypothetical protein